MEQADPKILDRGVPLDGAIRMGPEDRLVLVAERTPTENEIAQLTKALADRQLDGRVLILAGWRAAVVPPRHDPEDAAQRVVARLSERFGTDEWLGQKEVAEAVYAEVESANEMRVALGKIADHEPVIASEARLCRIAREALGR
jgi:hypothetical protein